MHKRSGIPAREKGVSSTCEKKPAGQINDLASVPISGVTVLLLFFLPSPRSIPLFLPYAARCLSQTGDRIAAFFFATVFFLPGRGKISLREEGRSLPWENPSAGRIETKVKEGSHRVAGLAARHQDLRGIHLE